MAANWLSASGTWWERNTTEDSLIVASRKFDLILRLIENLTVLVLMAISVSLLCWIAYRYGLAGGAVYLADHRPLSVVLASPFIFRTARKFFEEVREIFGVKRTAAEEPPQVPAEPLSEDHQKPAQAEPLSQGLQQAAAGPTPAPGNQV